VLVSWFVSVGLLRALSSRAARPRRGARALIPTDAPPALAAAADDTALTVTTLDATETSPSVGSGDVAFIARGQDCS